MKRRKGESLEDYHKRVAENDREDGIEGEDTNLTLEGLESALAASRKASTEETAKLVDSKIEALKAPNRGTAGDLAENKLTSTLMQQLAQ